MTSKLTAVILALLMSLPAIAEINSTNEAINKAGMQRMLTQRIVKSFALQGIHIQEMQEKVKLEKAINQFEDQLTELREFSPSEQISQALDTVESLWIPFKTIATSHISKENARVLFRRNDELLDASHRVVILLQDIASTPTGKLVKISALQRMLSQRLVKLYAYKIWGFPEFKLDAEMDRGIIKFKDALNQLSIAPENTPAIITKLDTANMQWDLYKHILERKEKQTPLITSRTSETLLTLMDELTGLYTALPEK